MIEEPVVETEASLGFRKPDRDRRERLGDGVEIDPVVGADPTFDRRFAFAVQVDPVHAQAPFPIRAEEVVEHIVAHGRTVPLTSI
jgi:hypothetical protein